MCSLSFARSSLVIITRKVCLFSSELSLPRFLNYHFANLAISFTTRKPPRANFQSFLCMHMKVWSLFILDVNEKKFELCPDDVPLLDRLLALRALADHIKENGGWGVGGGSKWGWETLSIAINKFYFNLGTIWVTGECTKVFECETQGQSSTQNGALGRECRCIAFVSSHGMPLTVSFTTRIRAANCVVCFGWMLVSSCTDGGQGGSRTGDENR